MKVNSYVLASLLDAPSFQCLDAAADHIEQAAQALNCAQWEPIPGATRQVLENLIERLDAIHTEVLILQESDP